MGFVKPPPGRASTPSPHLFVANCGPALGLDLSSIEQFFRCSFGPLAGPICQADASGTRVIVSFCDAANAMAARTALHGIPCPSLLNRILHVQFSHEQPPRQVKQLASASRSVIDISIPGLFLLENFISLEEEKELLSAVDQKRWHLLAKRRVQHYGYEFQYKTRNVDVSQKLGDLPCFTRLIVERISQLPQLIAASELTLPLDQLTVNEYPCGVGLSPHIDTHSAFIGAIVSLSLAGPCVMEFRKYKSELDLVSKETKRRIPFDCCSVLLPERSLLVLLDEARYRWHHYIPHHKIDHVVGQPVRRCQRRVSFTFRKVRCGPCTCKFPGFCDSQLSVQDS